MPTYSCRGLTAATAAEVATEQPIAQLWNPSSTEYIRLMEVGLTIAGVWGSSARNAPLLRRTSARGTGASSVTPTADNCWDANSAPGSGAEIDVALFSADPTFADPALIGWNISGAASVGTAGQGLMWGTYKGIWIPPSTGICISANMSGTNAFPASEVYFVWIEGV